MGVRELLNWSFFFILTVPLGILSCQECVDCGPTDAEPVTHFRFFNIDSLNKVEATLTTLGDSLERVIAGIDTGNIDLDTVRMVLETQINLYEQVDTDIKNGKLKIESVYGPNGEGPIYFRDSVTNDSLTTFPFPLDMNYDSCSFIIKIGDREDRVSVNYYREMDYASERIIMMVYDLEVVESSYDSAKVICNKSRCSNNETNIYFYF